jgi:hypothetical protein
MASISLGLQSPDGFDGADLTSPAQAAAAGALLDLRWEEDGDLPVELRIHGVSGSTGPEILGHPHALRVGGRNPTAFYRRWSPGGDGRPSVPWPLEAYSWGGLTERPLVSASWILLAPFMLYNIAYFMLPAGRGTQSRTHPVARALLRLLALAATLQFVGGLILVFVSTIGWQNVIGRFGVTWWWISWYTQAATPARMGCSVAVVGLITAVLWRASNRTAKRYEAFATSSTSGARRDPLRLRRTGFWDGTSAAVRQRNTHVAAGFAVSTLAVSSACTRTTGWQLTELYSAAAILVLTVILTAVATDRDALIGDGENQGRAGASAWAYRALAWVSALLLAETAISAPWAIPAPSATTLMPPWLFGGATVLMAVQFCLVIALALTVLRLRATSGRTEPEGWRPFVGGFSAPLIALFAVMLGGLLTSALNIAIARLFAQPSGVGLYRGHLVGRTRVVYLPDVAFAYSIGAVVAVLAVAAFGVLLWRRFRSLRNGFDGAQVRRWYPGPEGSTGSRPVRQVATHWAVAALTDQVGVVIAVLAVGWGAGAWGVEGFALVNGRRSLTGGADAVITFGVLVGALIAILGVWLLRSEYNSPTRRKTIGALWDVGTFWPRAAHPLAPPCYAEQAVPEIVDRIRLLTGEQPPGSGGAPGADGSAVITRPRKVLLTGYSQGTILSAAVVAQLHDDTLSKVSLLTLACPLRRLYGRAFPAYFGYEDATALTRLLSTTPAGEPPDELPRWRNLVRHTDYVGGWVFAPPKPDEKPAESASIDVSSLDPPSLLPGPGGALAPTHYHSDWWQDPLTLAYARVLTGLKVQR